MRLLALAVVACHAHAGPPLANQRASPPPATFEVTLARTGCFGTCPSYTVTIHADGSVDWAGEAYVAEVGARHGRIDAEGFARLQRAIDKVRFFELDSNGQLPRQFGCTKQGGKTECNFPDIVICTDTPVATITIKRNGTSHSVSNDHCRRIGVELLEDEIDEVANTRRWIGRS
jgi:hypothetical protein